MNLQKIKVEEKPTPNCRTMMKEDWPWELRWFDKDTGWVYAYHMGYLWPQNHMAKYWKFQQIVPQGEWQQFISRKDAGL